METTLTEPSWPDWSADTSLVKSPNLVTGGGLFIR